MKLKGTLFFFHLKLFVSQSALAGHTYSDRTDSYMEGVRLSYEFIYIYKRFDGLDIFVLINSRILFDIAPLGLMNQGHPTDLFLKINL